MFTRVSGPCAVGGKVGGRGKSETGKEGTGIWWIKYHLLSPCDRLTGRIKTQPVRRLGLWWTPGTLVLAPLKSTFKEQRNQKPSSVELVTESWFSCRAPGSTQACARPCAERCAGGLPR